MLVEVPKLLIVQPRTNPETVRNEQAALGGMARRSGLEPVFINPLGAEPWRGVDVLRDKGIVATLWTGSADLDISQPTTERDMAMDLLLPLGKRVVENQIPTVGICLGQQVLHMAVGGEVGNMPERAETGTVTINKTPAGEAHSRLRSMPPSFRSIAGHKDVLIRPAPGAVILGSTDRDPHSVTQIGDEVLLAQTHLEITDAVELRDRVAISEGSTLGEYIQTHPYDDPDPTDHVLLEFMANAASIRTRTRV